MRCGARDATRDDACMTGPLARSRRAHAIAGSQSHKRSGDDDGGVGRAGRGRGTLGRGRRALARRRRPPRPGRREEALPAREDVRRRSHAARRAPTARHGTRGAARAVPALRRAAVHRARRDPRAAVARPPGLPFLRIRGSAPRPRRDGGRARGEGRGDALAGGGGGRTAGRRRPGRRRRHPPRRDHRSRYGRSTSWSPTAPTRGSGARIGVVRDRTVPARHGDPRLLRRARSTTSRGSRATSTCTTARAATSRATAGCSRWATAP